DGSEGVAYADFNVGTQNPVLSKTIDRLSRIVATIPGTFVPFFVLPFFPSIIAFILLRTISDARGGILAGQVMLTILIFIVLLGAIPPLPPL
ncbi:MAG: hypothetical protein ACOC08_06930, partial [Campylobacterales bacterium]